MKNDKSWRAMLIKDNEGDWGICVAVWRGMKKGTPGIPGKINFLCIHPFWYDQNLIAIGMEFMNISLYFRKAGYKRKTWSERQPWAFCNEVYQFEKPSRQ